MLSSTWSTYGSCELSIMINPAVVGISQVETVPTPT